MRTKTIISYILIAGLLMSFAPVSQVSNFTKWVCGIDTAKPWILVTKDNVTGELKSYYIGEGSITPPSGSAPFVSVGDDKNIPADQSIVTLDGSASYSPSGADPLTYLWEKVSGTGGTITSPTSATTTASGLIAGTTYKFKLTVTDANDLSSSKVLTVTVSALASDQYYINKESFVNFTPKSQGIDGYTDLVGDPARSVLSVTTPEGFTISTISTSNWTGNPDHDDSSGLAIGPTYPTPSDPYGYQNFDSSVLITGFQNYGSQYQSGVNQIKISNTDPSKLYQIQLIGSVSGEQPTGDMYRTNYVIDGVSHSLNNYVRTSKSVVMDTVKPDSNGDIFLSVTGQDNTQTGSTGIISAMKIYEISKSSVGEMTTRLYSHYYDTIFVNDGGVNRMCIYYKPYNYNPAKKYPLLVYLDGQEDAVKDYNWDDQILTGDGVGIVAEHEKGKMYGINADGDTSSFFILFPQTSLSEWSLTSSQTNALISNFKSRFSDNINDSLFLMGFSSGAGGVTRYLYKYPYKVTAAYIQSPATGGSESMPSTDVLRDSSAKFSTYGTKVWLTERGDMFAAYTDSMYKYINLGAPNNLYYRYIGLPHNGFAKEYRMDDNKVAPKYSQNPYDFFVNPAATQPKVAYFCFRMQTANQVPDLFTNLLGDPSYQNPTQAVLTATDAVTGWSLNTVATTKWSWSIPSKFTYTANMIYPYWVNIYVLNSSGVYNSKDATFASNGADLQLTGLEPNTNYELWMLGNSLNSNVTTYSTSTSSVDYNTGQSIDKLNFVRITGTSDASGNLDIGVYGKTNDDIGILTAMIVKEVQ